MSPSASILGRGLPGLASELETILDIENFSGGEKESSKLDSEGGDTDSALQFKASGTDAETDSSSLAGNSNRWNSNDQSGEDQFSLYNSDEEDGDDQFSHYTFDEEEDGDEASDLDSTDSQEGAAQESNTPPIDNLIVQNSKSDIRTVSETQTDEQLYLVLLGGLKNRFFNTITISDDQSAGSKIEERNLLVLRGSVDKAPVPQRMEALRLPPPAATFQHARGNHELQDYQMQLMLLEQQNKKRLLMARQEQDFVNPAGNSSAMALEAVTSAPDGAVPTTGKSNGLDDQMSKTDLQGVLDGADASQLDLQKLQDYIKLLQLKAQEYERTEKEKAPSRYQIIYRIKRMETVHDRKGSKKFEQYLPFFDHPEWVKGQGTNRIQSNLPLSNFELYLERNKDVAFIVYRNFDTDSPRIVAKPRTDDDDASERLVHLPQYTSETIRPVEKSLIEAIKTLLGSKQEYADILREFSTTFELAAPYLFIYYSRESLKLFLDSLPLIAKAQLSLLSDFVTEEYADEYSAADSLLSQGKISPEHVRYLFKPGDLLVSRVDGQYMGYVSTSWPKISYDKQVSPMRATNSGNGTALSLYGSQDAEARMATKKVTVNVCRVSVWHWDFDGNFQRIHKLLELELPAIEDGKNAADVKGKGMAATQGKEYKRGLGEKNISDLNIFPMRFAPAEIVDKCRRRGKTFWKCRTRNFVSYRDSGMESIQNLVDERYMVDLKTHRNLHPESRYGQTPLLDELGPEAMARGEPPDEQFELLLPLKIKGYNLRRKKWFDLMADRIYDVTWNKEAFQNLVIDRKARDLIRALVSNQLAAEKGTDLIMGKGNGLILLLHGGPGTGKTLTAESVAEIAEKPLYRVTCGDVGTKAEDVEKYLESVLHLGKIWGCVVLLDEADVFLEQRSLEDMQRNALVSVFLRVLEYYEGILILTSNRVGTFDEAFKSRIQLALHYPVLGPYQRLRIWENFLNRLESFGDDDKVDIADLREHLEELKEEKMNGRQIRNAITTARQYAEWKGKTLTYEHLSDVIEVSGRFDQYLDRLNGGFTQDQLAQDEGLRLA